MSITTLPQRYRSRWTGREIDELLNSVGSKLDATIITTDINNGDTNRVPSASITKYLNEKVNELNDPNYIASILQRLPDQNPFTDQEKDKLARINEQFKGSFLNETVRENNLNTTDFLGGEITFIIQAGEGLSRFDWFNNNTRLWVPAKFIADGEINSIDVPVPSSIKFTGFTIGDKTSCKIIVSALSDDRVKVVECLVTTNGLNVFMTHTNVAGTFQSNPFDMFEIVPMIESGDVNIYVTTKITNVSLSGKVIAEI